MAGLQIKPVCTPLIAPGGSWWGGELLSLGDMVGRDQ